MLSFISEENYEIHKGYLRTLKLKYSILEKSINDIKNKNIDEIIKQKMKRKDKQDVLELLFDIVLHETFFSSFSDNTFLTSDMISSLFGSEASFLNEVFRFAMRTPSGFICIYRTTDRIHISTSEELDSLYRYGAPELAIDVSEHAYFLDYGFDKERYLRSALPHFNLSRLV